MGRCKTCVYQNDVEFDACHICNNEKDMFRKKPTNADRIRAMTDAELGEYLFIKTCEDGFPQFTTKNDWIDWLRQEAT